MTFICQDPEWTLLDSSLNMKLYYKDQLHLTENGNMKFSKLIIETLQDILSPQSLQSSSSYMSQLSLVRSPSPSSLPRSNLSVQTLSQSSSSQSLSATATPFNPKHQIIFHNSLTAPPKSQTLTASPSFCQDFSSSHKTTSDHMSSAKPTKLIKLHQPLHLLQLILHSHLEYNFNHHLTLHFHFHLLQHLHVLLLFHPLLYPQTHILFSAPPSTSCHHLIPHPPSKVPATPDSSLHVAQHITEEVQISPAIPQRA